MMTVVTQGAKRIVEVLPATWQSGLRKLFYRYSIRREPEPAEFTVIRHLLVDGARIVDAGANLGIYTRFLARYSGERSDIVSIEPIPTTFDMLQSNVQSLKLRNVRLVQCALSNVRRRVVIEVPEDDRKEPVHYLARIQFSDRTRPLSSTFSVEARTLDDLVGRDEKPVCLIKYDVEMHELESITGSLALIRRDHPAIYVEIQPDLTHKRSQRDEIIALLERERYQPFWYDGSGLRRWTPEAAVLDFFFLTASHCRRLAAAGVMVSGPVPEMSGHEQDAATTAVLH
jgi:FkbM family methyltransferase